MNLDRILLTVEGYMELDMPEEALHELSSMDASDQHREDVLQIKLFILMRIKRWKTALEICKLLQKLNPDMPGGYIHGAFCLHEMSQTAQAKAMLLGGPISLSQEPTYYYNLACYDAILGDLKKAEKNLNISFRMDEKFREIAKFDPDLKAINYLV